MFGNLALSYVLLCNADNCSKWSGLCDHHGWHCILQSCENKGEASS